MVRAEGARWRAADPDREPGAAFPASDGAAASIDVRAIVVRARDGDRAAFALLVEHQANAAYRVARAILGSEADARDATQDAFLLAWRELRRLRDPACFDAWLRRILVNRCRQLLRGRGRRAVREIAACDLADPMDGLAAGEPVPEESAASRDALERAFEHLSVDQRAALVLHHLEHLPVATIAASLDVPAGTVKSRLFAARHALEQALEAELR